MIIAAVFTFGNAALLGCSEQNVHPASGSPNAESKRTAPPKKLSTVDDAKTNKALEFEEDDMSQMTWFSAKNHERSHKKFRQWSSIKAYFGWYRKTSSFGPLRMKATYHGDDWVFARQLIIKIDANDPVAFDIHDYRKSDVSSGVWEYYDVPLADKDMCFDLSYSIYNSDICKVKRVGYETGPKLESFCSPQMMSATKVKVRFDGDRAFTFELPRNQLEDIKAVCGAYIALAR